MSLHHEDSGSSHNFDEAFNEAWNGKPNGHAKGAKGARKLATLWADDVTIDLSTTGVIDGLLPSNGLVVLYGESGCGKTFTAVDMACHVAAGMPWRDLTVEQGVVVYVAAEAPVSVERRLWAWKKHHGVERLPVLVVQSSVDLLNGSTDAIVELLCEVAAEHGRIAMVVVDTLARAMTGNENAPDDMGRFVAACGRIREAGETCVLVVHHSGKDLAKGARGHSSLRAATDVELEVTNGEAGGCVKVTKSRDETGGCTYGFALEPVELGVNPKGRTVTTCVSVTAEAPEKPAKERAPRRLSDKGKLVVEAISKAIKYKGQRPPSHPETDSVTNAVTVTDARLYWRQLIGWDHLSEPERDKSRQDWKRGVENAQAAGAIGQWDRWLWVWLWKA